MNAFLLVSLVLVVGAAGGWAARRARLPSIVGNILAGILVGPALGLVRGDEALRSFGPITNFAMGLISVAIGGHLSWRRLHNALGRVAAIGLLQVACSAGFVGAAAWWLTGHWVIAALLGALAVTSAPATIVSVVRETRAKGPYVKTLLSVVALDNLLGIALFVVVHAAAIDHYAGSSLRRSVAAALLYAGWHLGGAALLGAALGWLSARLVVRHELHDFSVLFVTILLGWGAARQAGMSPLLACLALGVFLGNSSRQVERHLDALQPVELLLYVSFFTVAGITTHLEALPQLGWLGLAYVVARVAGKGLGALLGALASGTSPRIAHNLPLGLVPQGGLTIALVVLLQSHAGLPPTIRATVATLVMATIVMNELFGPLLTSWSIARAKETGLDRRRLVEFLQEEFILADLRATDKWDAIRQLSDFLVRSHRVTHATAEGLYATVVERERQTPTAVGLGAALPHGLLDEGPEVQGVLGLCPQGVDWEVPGQGPVHLVMLLVAPRDDHDQYLRVLACLARMLRDDVIRSQLLAARTANDAWEVIESEETPNYNYFLEDGEPAGQTRA